MSLFIIPEWLQRRKVLKTDLSEIHVLFLERNGSMIGDLTVDLLKNQYQTLAKVNFYKAVRVLGFYGVQFSGRLSSYSGPRISNPDVLSINCEHYEKKLTDYIGMPSSALLKSCGITTLEQLHGVPLLSIKKILDCITSVDDFLEAIPVKIVPATPDLFDTAYKEKQSKSTENNLKNSILDQSINILDLSIRPYNCLVNKGVATIGDLIRLEPDELLAIKNFGRKSLREITKKLSGYNLKLGHAQQDAYLFDTVNFAEEYGNLPVAALELSVRATNCLQRANIITVGQLLRLSNQELMGLANVGSKTLTELREKLTTIRNHKNLVAQSGPIANYSNCNLDDEKILASLSTPTKNLVLTVRTKKVLAAQQIEYLWQLVQLTEKNLLKWKNFGRKSLTELKNKLAEYDLRLGLTFTPDQIKKIQSFEETPSTQDLSIRILQLIDELQVEKISFLTKRENQLVHERLWPDKSNKRTLEEIATAWSRSRERVRQIEKKARHKILQQYRKDLEIITDAIKPIIFSCGGLAVISRLPNPLFTTDDQRQRIITELFSLVKKDIFFDWQYDLVSGNGKDWLNQICRLIRKNIQMKCADKLFSPDILDDAIADVISEHNLNATYVFDPLKNKTIDRENITLSGGLLCFGKMTKQDKSSLAFKNCFPEGLEIHKQSELLITKFQEYDPTTFQNTSPRSVVARLADHPDIFLWGRGFYVHRESVEYDPNLVTKATESILQRFDHGHPKFNIDLPFNRFKDTLKKGGIPNEYALYTLIRLLHNNRIGQRKFPALVDCQSGIDIHQTVVEELENYMLAAKGAVKATELKGEFIEKRGWKSYRLQLQASQSDKIYPWVNQSYIHVEYLPVNHDKLEDLIAAICQKLGSLQGAYSLKGAKQDFQILWQQACPDAPIQTMIKLIRNSGIPDLEINHYLISLRNDDGAEAVSLAAELEDYFIEHNRAIATYELKNEFQDKRGWSDNQYYGAVRKATLFQVSKNTFVYPSTIHWNSALYETIHDTLSEYLQKNVAKGIPHIILSEIIDEYILPELPNCIEWTTDLLKSTGKEYNDFIFFDDACIFTDNPFNIEDLDDMIAFLMSRAFEYNLAKQQEVEKLLWREGILASGRTIPSEEVFFPESSIKYLPDSHEIMLSRIGEERYGSQKPA